MLHLKASVDMTQGNERKFACPSDFIPCPFTLLTSFTKEKLNRSNTELWLIKAPFDFNPSSFNSKNIPLIGFRSEKIKNDGKTRLYNIFSSARETCASHLLVPSEDHDQLLSGPSFQGHINICDSFGEPSGDLHPVPATPTLKITVDLKQRFQPFGATAATRSEAMISGLGEDGEQVTDCNLIVETDRVKRRKKKKQKHEVEQVLDRLPCVKQLVMDREGACGNSPEILQDTRGPCLLSKSLPIIETTMKKRKKKKRAKELAEVSATALEMENDLEDETFLSVIKEEAITEPLEDFSDKTGWIEHCKKKKKLISQEILEDRFSPTATELGSVFKKKKCQTKA